MTGNHPRTFLDDAIIGETDAGAAKGMSPIMPYGATSPYAITGGTFGFNAYGLGAIADRQAAGAFGGRPPSGGFSQNLATGQNPSGVIQTGGDLADASWTVTNADHFKNGPIAYTVAPGEADWFRDWMTNGPGSSWIAADPDTNVNGNVTYTITFNLSGFDPADATLVGGQFMLDDGGTVSLNGHVLGSQAFDGWRSGFTALSNGAGDFVAGVNTLVIQTTGSDHRWEAARLEGTIVDTVASGPPGPVHWSKAVSGAFNTAADWAGGAVPGSNNDAILDAAGTTAYTVTSSTSLTVNSIQTAATATLAITGGTFTASNGAGSGANTGAIQIGNGATLTVGGSLVNAGTIELASSASGAATSLMIASGTTLSGAGKVVLSDQVSNQIVGGASAVTLTNTDNTISGAGTIGSSTLTLVNKGAGVIDATGADRLILNTGSNTIVNAGLIEAAGAGGMTIESAVANTGGVIAAGGGSRIALLGVDVIGGALETTGGSAVRIKRGAASVLDGVASAIDDQAQIIVTRRAALTIEGSIVNGRGIHLVGKGVGAPTLTVGAAGVTLSGGGRIGMDDSAGDLIIGAASTATLTNIDNFIGGAGRLGGGQLRLVNQAAGVISGDQATALVIDTGANTVVNAGLIVSRGAGGTTIASAVANSGRLEAIGSVLTVDGAVSGAGMAVIDGGTIDFASSFSQAVMFEHGLGVLGLAQSQGYGGTIMGFSKSGGTSLDLGDIGFVGAGEATFSGTKSGGVLTVTDGTHTASLTLEGDYRGTTFTASSDGHGGTIVVDGPTPAAFIAAMAAMAAPSGQAIHTRDAGGGHAVVLARPHACAA